MDLLIGIIIFTLAAVLQVRRHLKAGRNIYKKELVKRGIQIFRVLIPRGEFLFKGQLVSFDSEGNVVPSCPRAGAISIGRAVEVKSDFVLFEPDGE